MINPYKIICIIGMLGSCSSYACNNTPAPVPPTPDSGDAGAYVNCCAMMGDTTTECPKTLQHVVEQKLEPIPVACSKCGLACP